MTDSKAAEIHEQFVPIKTWANLPVDPLVEPWYRFSRVLEYIDPHVPKNEKISWLDTGCQMGQFLTLVRQRYDCDAYGIDDFAQDKVVEVCKKYLSLEINHADEIMEGWNYTQRQIDKDGISLDRTFHVISGLEVIEHIIDTDAFLAECRLHLKDNGLLVFSTPNFNSLRNRLTVPLGFYPTGPEYRTVIHHVRVYKADALTQHVESFGFRRLAIGGVTWLPVRWLKTPFMRTLDRMLADSLPSFAGNLIAVFQKDD